MRQISLLRVFGVLLAAVLFAAACGDEADDVTEPEDPEVEDPEPDEPEEPDQPEEADEPEDEVGELEVTEVTVATLPLIPMAPFFLAIEEGIFEEEGLTVTPEIGVGGAELIPRMQAGELDLAFSAYVPMFTAAEAGIDIQLIANGYNYQEVGDRIWGWQVMPDSDIETIEDLEGATVGSNTHQSPGELVIRMGFHLEGLDPDTLDVVEVPFPQMAPALERGEIDAGWIGEPFLTQAQDQLDVRPILDPEAEERVFHTDPVFFDFPVGGWVATGEWLEEHPNTAAAFQRAIEAANEQIANDHDLGREVAEGFTEVEEDVLARVDWPTYPPLEVDALQDQADMMHEVGFLDSPLDVTEMLRFHLE